MIALIISSLVALVLAAAPAAQGQSPASECMARLALQQAQLTAPDGTPGDCFGWSVAVSGDTALVGACDAYSIQGLAYVFVRSGSRWTLQQELNSPDGAAADSFGRSVALSGGTALVGAPFHDIGSDEDRGSAYLFTRSGSRWTLQQELIAGGGAAYDAFGCSVALSGDTALIGARHDDPFGHLGQGGAYFFVRSGASWTLQQHLYAGDGVAGDYFGSSVALSGETALVGAPQRDVAGSTHQGSAYVFTRSGTVWTYQQTLFAIAGADLDRFGSAVALFGDTALVGAPEDDVGGQADQGSAYVFTRSGGVWTPQQLLLSAGGVADGEFGTSVALCGEIALVGAHKEDVGANTAQGTAHFFTRSGSTWTLERMLTADGGVANSEFGASVALSGTTALVGAYGDTVGSSGGQGSAYVFQLDTTRPTTTAYAASVRKGRKVKLAYKVSDAAPSCGQASVTIKIYKGKRLKKTLRPGVRACNVKQRYSWRCTLAKGRYTVKVYAKDAAGNAQSKVGRATLTVK